MLQSGDLVGAYRIDAPLAAGGMGVVYRGRHATLGHTVAIKALLPNLALKETVRLRFAQEAWVQAQLQHPGVARIIDFVQTETVHAIVMEFIEGCSLEHVLTQERAGAWPLEDAMRLLRPIVAAMAYAHARKVVHRDLKPANVLMDRRGGAPWPGLPKLTDFGLARLMESAGGMTREGTRMGTIPYMPPEQFSGKSVDARADVFALGMLARQLVVGALPVDPNDLMAATLLYAGHTPLPSVGSEVPGPPAPFVSAVDAALSLDPSDRPATAEAPTAPWVLARWTWAADPRWRPRPHRRGRGPRALRRPARGRSRAIVRAGSEAPVPVPVFRSDAIPEVTDLRKPSRPATRDRAHRGRRPDGVPRGGGFPAATPRDPGCRGRPGPSGWGAPWQRWACWARAPSTCRGSPPRRPPRRPGERQAQLAATAADQRRALQEAWQALERFKTDRESNSDLTLVDTAVVASATAVGLGATPEALGLHALSTVWSHKWHYGSALGCGPLRRGPGVTEKAIAQPSPPGLLAHALLLGTGCALMPDTEPIRAETRGAVGAAYQALSALRQDAGVAGLRGHLDLRLCGRPGGPHAMSPATGTTPTRSGERSSRIASRSGTASPALVNAPELVEEAEAAGGLEQFDGLHGHRLAAGPCPRRGRRGALQGQRRRLPLGPPHLPQPRPGATRRVRRSRTGSRTERHGALLLLRRGPALPGLSGHAHLRRGEPGGAPPGTAHALGRAGGGLAQGLGGGDRRERRAADRTHAPLRPDGQAGPFP